MIGPRYDSIAVGDEIPLLVCPKVDRTSLALFAGASGDHNPIHLDPDVARRAGMPDVFAQGMLVMAWLGRMLTTWVAQSQLRRYRVRFQGITHLGNVLHCHGNVIEKLQQDGENQVRLELRVVNQYGQTKIVGEALVALP
jgi:acyl dehydratase